MYAKSNSYGEYVFDHGWANAFEQAGGDYYPKLQVAVPFSPVPGPRLLVRPGSGVPAEALAGALVQACQELKLSGIHATFCTEDEWHALGRAGWLQRLGQQYHWENRGYATFDDFLATLSSRKRKVLRRERRDANASGLVFRTLRGPDIGRHEWDAFYRFYQSMLGERLGDRVVLMLAEHDGKPVAGALNLMGRDALYGRNWGCSGDWPFLHFELCYYRAIDFAIEHGLARVEAGAQGQHKIQRGYLPKPTYSAHWLSHGGLRRAVSEFLDEERPAILAGMAELEDEFSPYRKGDE
jgi:predicted N-acyltransferase